MTKCLLKALKAVNLDNHVELFRSLGYDSAGALAHFHKEHFKKLNLSSEELLRVHALLDVLKEATREGKICPHYSKSNKPTTTTIRAKSVEPPVHHNHENSQLIRANTFQLKKQSNENLKPKRSSSSIGQRLSTSNKTHANGFILQKPSSNNHDQQFFGPKSLSNRPAVQHVKVKSYNYGIPKTKQQQRNTSHHVRYQHETNLNHPSIFIQSSNHSNDIISYAKPAEIYVYARKRPLLSNETNFRDIISVPDNKHMIMSETKSNLDCTPLLKKSEFQFDQVFSSDASNKQVFENTVLPFLSSNHHRHNLTYICFGQTGSGKSHTIFGSRNTDGLIIYCVQLLLQEVNLQNKLLCSFYEIYNNQVYDLINTGKRLFVREDGEHHVNIVGLTEIILKNLDTLRSIIYDGLAKRHHGKSAFNSNSSRSHAIFQIILKNTSNQNDYFRMVFIDLAGSERAIDAQNNQKQTRREGAQINSSLLALKECIRSMDMTHSHAPFRQSKLTHILRDSLVGTKTRTCLMANVLPANDCCQCSLNTLQYASRIRDISIKHRHRSMSINNIQRNYIDNDEQQIETIIREKPQRTFKPATASTPVHRLMTSVDHRTYMSTNQQTDVDNHKRIPTTTTKTPDIDWRIVDNDIPISGSGDNVRIKSVLSSTREFLLNTNTNNQNQNGTSFYLTRYEQPRKKHLNQEENTSSYFPPPQTDIKKSSTNEIQTSSQPWISVPISSTRRLSDSSIEPSTSSRIIPIQVLDDNQYSSATGTESLGTKITKLATGTNPHQTKTKIENLNLNKQYDTAATTTTITTTDTEQGLYSDRQATHRDQTGFFSNRDDPLYENNLKSTNLTTITQRTSPIATPKNSSHNYKSDPISTSSKKTFSSPNKTHRNRHIKPSSSSSSSSSSLAGINSNKKPHYSSSKQQHHRIVPYHNSDSDDIKYQSKQSSSTRNESSQTQTNIQIMKNEQEQTDDQFLLEQFSDETSKNFLQAPLDQIKHFYDQTTSLSPPKDYGIRVSDQLNTLRTLLETRLMEQDNLNHQHHSIKDLSLLKSSPETFTKEFLQSYKYKNHSTEFISDLDDDQPQINTKDKYESDALSTSSSSVTDEIHQEKLHSTPTVSSTTSTIKSNYSTKIDTHESRILSNSGNDIYPRKTSISNSDIIESISDSERISDANSGSQNRYTSASSEGSSINHSRTQTPIRNSPFDVTTGFHEHLIDSGKGSSLLTGTSFDVLMNSLKNMREKDLDYLIHSSDDSLIRVTD